jgi:hypothetical protein
MIHILVGHSPKTIFLIITLPHHIILSPFPKGRILNVYIKLKNEEFIRIITSVANECAHPIFVAIIFQTSSGLSKTRLKFKITIF